MSSSSKEADKGIREGSDINPVGPSSDEGPGKGVVLSFNPDDHPELDEDASTGWRARRKFALDLKGLTSTQNESQNPEEEPKK